MMRVEYITRVEDDVVTFYRTGDDCEGFGSLSVANFRDFLDREQARLNELRADLEMGLGQSDAPSD